MARGVKVRVRMNGMMIINRVGKGGDVCLEDGVRNMRKDNLR